MVQKPLNHYLEMQEHFYMFPIYTITAAFGYYCRRIITTKVGNVIRCYICTTGKMCFTAKSLIRGILGKLFQPLNHTKNYRR